MKNHFFEAKSSRVVFPFIEPPPLDTEPAATLSGLFSASYYHILAISEILERENVC
jgi:hypothetical protein